MALEENINHLIQYAERPLHRIDDDALVQAPTAEVGAICGFIGVELCSDFVPHVQLRKLADENSRVLYDRFVEDHLALLARPAVEEPT